MKKLLLILPVVGALAACGRDDVRVLECDEYRVTVSGVTADTIDVVVDEQAVVFTRVMSADGARYAGKLDGKDTELWNKGDEWFWGQGDTFVDCTVK
jgi:membrane-bound inhibitor of C-type lysozyme